MTPLEQLQSAGFSEQEIGQWAGEQRSTLQQAGFADAEIDHYFAGPKEPLPPAFLDRLSIGSAIVDGRAPTDKGAYSGVGMGDYGPGDFLVGLWKGLTTPSAQLKQELQGAGPGKVAGAIVGRVPIGQIIDQIRQGGESLEAATTGQPVSAEEMIGNSLLGMTGPVTRLPGGPITRLDHDPTTGGLRETPIGGLPEPTDFTAAAQTVMGDPAPRPPVVEKLRQLWRQYGIHPSEVAHDATGDPTIAQDLASTTTELPSAYTDAPEPRAMPPGPAPDAAPSGIAELRPGELRVDPERFQFKAGGDLAGVNERLLDIDTWDPIKAGLGIVFEDRDGVRWIADGHQRLGLAKRIEAADPAQQPRLNAWVLREADGYTDADVRAIAAGKNIAEGTGTVVDAAKVLRDRPDLLPSLPPRSETVRQATALTSLDAQAFGKVVNGVVPPNYAAVVGRLVPGDATMQNALIDLLAKTKPANVVQAEAIVRQGLDAGTRTQTQATLFGDEEVTTSLYSERARILDNALRMLRRNRALLETLVDNTRILEDLGNRLAGDANARQAAIDGHASQTLQTLANRVGPLSDALTAAARDLAAGKPLAAVSRDFVDAIRRQAESGSLTRGADGRPGGAVEAARAGRAARAEPVADERNPRVVTPAEDAAANDQVREALGRAYHGTPHTFEAEPGAPLGQFRLEAVGTGEGAQAFGHGIYLAEAETVARRYRTKLTERQFIRKVQEIYDEFDSPEDATAALKADPSLSPAERELLAALEEDDWLGGFEYPHQAVAAALREPHNFDLTPRTVAAIEKFGNVYEVNIKASADRFLDWDKPLSEQPAIVESLQRAGISPGDLSQTGKGLHESLLGSDKTKAAVAQKLNDAGIAGIRYLDRTSRRSGEGTSNYVVFDPKNIEVIARNGERVATPEVSAIAETIRPEPLTADEDAAAKLGPGTRPIDDPLAMQQRGELTAARAAQIRNELGRAAPEEGAAEHLDPQIWTVIADNLAKAEASREGGVEVIADQMRYLPDDGVAKTISEREAIAVIARALDAEVARGGDVRGFLAEADAAYRAAGHGTPPDVSAAEAARTSPAAERPYFFPDPNAPPVGMSIGWPKRRLSPAEETVLSHIDVGGRRSRHPLSWASLYTNMVDRLNPIPDRDAAGARVPTPANPYRLMRMLSGDPGKSQGWLTLGQVDYATGNKIGPSLQEILAPVRGDLNPLRAFMDSVRALELEGKGITTGFDPAAIRQVAASGMQEFGPIMARLVEYQNNLLKYMRDAGVLSDQSYTDIVSNHQSYVPFHAVLDEASQRFGGGTLQPNNPLYRIEGSQRVKVDPLESILEHTYQYVSMAERNRAATAMVDLLQSRGEATPATAATAAERQVRTFDNGTEKLWEVERDIADTVKSLDGDAAGFLARWLGSDRAELRTVAQLITAPARTLRAGATLSPDFLLRNPIRDYFSALLQSEKPVFTPWDQVKGFYSTVVRDEYFRRWMQGGGGSAELVAMDRRYLQEDLRKLSQDTGLMTRGWNVVRNPLDILRTVSEYSERATRLGEFRYVYDRELRAGATPDEASRAAAYASREVSVDFSRRGAVTQSLNMIDAFWNASVQGTDRFVRQMRDHPYATSLKVAAGITLPSTLLWWTNHDDPRWKELPAYQRDLFWIVMTDKWSDMGPAAGQADATPYAHGGTSWRIRGGRYERNDGAIFRLPKPFEPGIVFGSGVERMLDAYFTDNPGQLADWSKSVAAAVLPVPGSTLGAPMLEQYANRSLLTDSNLIPQYLEKELPEYQYQPYTTETAKALGKLIAAFPGMREVATGHSQASGVARALTTPILLENYVRAWTGGGGMYLLKIADSALRQQGIVPDPPRPADTLADIPVVKAFVVRYPSAGSASIQRFYDEFERNQRYFTSWQTRAKEGDLEAMQRIQQAGGPRLFVQMDGIKTAMSEQTKVIRDITVNPQITPDEKRQLIDTLYFGLIELARGGVQAMRQADQALAPGPPPAPPVGQPAMPQPQPLYRQPPPSPGALPINP